MVGLGMYTGAMLTIGLGLGRYWLSLEPTAFEAWFTPNFWFLLPTIALTLPVAFVGTAWSFRLSRGQATRRRWRVALGLLFATLVVTLAYHLPANLRIWSGALGPSELRSELVQWLWMHLLRVGPALAATWMAFGATTRADAR